jgi:hypothetical protein
MTKTQKTLALLGAAGAQGLPATTLALEVGHRFGSAISDLRKAGHEISTEKRSNGFHYYTLLDTCLAPLEAGPNAFQRFQRPSEPMSVRRAWQFIANALRDGDALARATVVDLLARQPELLTNRSIRHNLGARKSALLDQLAFEARLI